MVNFTYNSNDRVLTCNFPARLDTIVCMKVSEQIADKLNTMHRTNDAVPLLEDRIVFDLKEVSFIASSFIRICVHTAKQVQKGNFSIISSDPFIKKTFKIAGLDEILNLR